MNQRVTNFYRTGFYSTCFALLGVVWLWCFYANFWIAEDSYLTYRVAYLINNGYGPVFSVIDRTQTFSNPLWLLLITVLINVLKPETVFFTLSLIASILTLLILSRPKAGTYVALILPCIALLSRSFIHYSSSGYGYPIVFVLTGLFTYLFLYRKRETSLIGFSFLAALVALTGLTYFLLLLPAFYKCFRDSGLPLKIKLVSLTAGFSPVIFWYSFSFLFYGFPFSTYFFTGIIHYSSISLILSRGFDSLIVSFLTDPITLVVILTVTGNGIISGARDSAIGVGILLYLIIIVWTGGEPDLGSSLAVPFFVALIAAGERVKAALSNRQGQWVLPSLLLFTAFALPETPFKTGIIYEPQCVVKYPSSIRDAQGCYWKYSNPLFKSGDKLLEAKRKIAMLSHKRKSCYYGIDAGLLSRVAPPALTLIHPSGITDPLLSRLPPPAKDYVNSPHPLEIRRTLPDGFLEACENVMPLINDINLREYYQDIAILTRSDSLQPARILKALLYSFSDRIIYTEPYKLEAQEN